MPNTDTELYMQLIAKENATLFVTAEDPEVKIFKRAMPRFTGESYDLHIIDPFRGKRTWMLNREFYEQETLNTNYFPTVIMDTNVASYLNAYIRLPNKMKARDKAGNRSSHIIDTAESIIRLHSLDTAYFESTGHVRVDPTKVSDYLEQFNQKSLRSIVEQEYENMRSSKHINSITEMSQVYYAILVEIAVIHLNHKAISSKITSFFDFLDNTIQYSSARMILVALLYFTGKFASFIPIQKGADSNS